LSNLIDYHFITVAVIVNGTGVQMVSRGNICLDKTHD
jgi:hypothetical protein